MDNSNKNKDAQIYVYASFYVRLLNKKPLKVLFYFISKRKKKYEIGFLLKPLEFSRYMLLEETSVSSYSQTKTALKKKMRNK